jgi:hypothetical protein
MQSLNEELRFVITWSGFSDGPEPQIERRSYACKKPEEVDHLFVKFMREGDIEMVRAIVCNIACSRMIHYEKPSG